MKEKQAKSSPNSSKVNQNDKKKSVMDSLIDPDKMAAMNLGLFIVIAIVLFYFGWGLDLINERHITKWLRTIYRTKKP